MAVASLSKFTVPLANNQSADSQGLLMPKLKYRFRATFVNFGVMGPACRGSYNNQYARYQLHRETRINHEFTLIYNGCGQEFRLRHNDSFGQRIQAQGAGRDQQGRAARIS